MKAKLIKLSIVIIVGLVSFYAFWKSYDFFENEKEKKSNYKIHQNQKKEIQDGDIILRYGYGFFSDYIVEFFNEKYKISHCGVIRKTKDSLLVIHSESSSYLSFEGVQAQDFDSYVDASHLNSVIVVRFKNSTAKQRARISEKALFYAAQKIPFDYKFDMSDSTEMYCSEVIWHAVKDVFQKDIYKYPNKKINYAQFENFYDSLNFEIIINHQEKPLN